MRGVYGLGFHKTYYFKFSCTLFKAFKVKQNFNYIKTYINCSFFVLVPNLFRTSSEYHYITGYIHHCQTILPIFTCGIFDVEKDRSL
jgi:hypothetical protein